MNLKRRIIETTAIDFDDDEIKITDIPSEYLTDRYFIVAEQMYEGCSKISLVYRREETDDEYNTRIAKLNESEENSFKMQQKREYQEYLKLKAKFEGNGSN